MKNDFGALKIFSLTMILDGHLSGVGGQGRGQVQRYAICDWRHHLFQSPLQSKVSKETSLIVCIFETLPHPHPIPRFIDGEKQKLKVIPGTISLQAKAITIPAYMKVLGTFYRSRTEDLASFLGWLPCEKILPQEN